MSIRKNKQLDNLFKSFLMLHSVEECYDFFEDLCTMKELRDLSQRLFVAQLIDEGASYQKAADETGASSATIGRVKKCLEYGSGGYRFILDRMKLQEESRAQKDEN